MQISAVTIFYEYRARNLLKAPARASAATGCHLPHGVHVGGRQAGAAHRGAVVGSHNPFCQEKVPKQTGHKQVLPEELLEKVCQESTGVTWGASP